MILLSSLRGIRIRRRGWLGRLDFSERMDVRELGEVAGLVS